MRVIAGSARRMTLEVVKGSSARPFLEIARGALFNSIAGSIPGSEALDLFAGSGALGIEALSRGAASCTFVEREKASAAIIEKNLSSCEFENQGKVICRSVELAVREMRKTFDLVFIDPPFADAANWSENNTGGELMEQVGSLLTDEGLLMFRYEPDDKKAEAPKWKNLKLLKDREYGRSRVCIYHRT